MKILLEVQIPDELATELMQAMRDFDMKYDPKHEGKVQVRLLMRSDHSLEEMDEMFNTIKPMPKYRKIFRCEDEPV
jgi:hypothetical protein